MRSILSRTPDAKIDLKGATPGNLGRMPPMTDVVALQGARAGRQPDDGPEGQAAELPSASAPPAETGLAEEANLPPERRREPAAGVIKGIVYW